MIKYDIKKINLGKTTAIFLTYKGITTFSIVPTKLIDKVVYEKIACDLYPNFGHCIPIPMVDVSLKGDGFSRWFVSGDYMNFSTTSTSLRLVAQEVSEEKGIKTIVSTLKNDVIEAKQSLFYEEDTNVFKINTEVKNISENPIVLENISTFQLAGISPFMKENDTDHILIHDLQNYWSGEARLHTKTLSELSMYDAWSHLGVRGYKIEQKGSMPTRSHIPFIALEDCINGVTWAAHLYEAGSWQLEALHANTQVSISGGIINFNNGHFSKELKPNEVYSTHEAKITVEFGNCYDVFDNLAKANKQITNHSKYEENLPFVYNEYLYTFGNPTYAKLAPLVPIVKNRGCKYFVMDAGWYDEGESWQTLGDWIYSKTRFPNGLSELTSLIRKNDMIPGIWFEFESVSNTSDVARQHPEYLLTRNGTIICNEGRCFLDFRKKEVNDFLYERVIRLLKDNDFGYLKVDYNENIGIGIDGPDGFAEELNKHLNCVINFFKLIKKEMPDLVLEMCSSGGMRHSPIMLELSDMCSFSDAHYDDEGVPIAMGLHRIMEPRKMQIWADLEQDFTKDKFYFALAKGMLGRICISGEYSKFSNEQLAIIDNAFKFYESIKGIIREGKTILIQDPSTNLKNLFNKEFVLVRENKQQKIIYYFGIDSEQIEVKIPVNEKYELVSSFNNVDFKLTDKYILFKNLKQKYNVAVVLLKRKEL